jgi:hypothetical protein
MTIKNKYNMLDVRILRNFAEKVPSEWKYFQEWAKRFDDYVAERRYGILIMNAKPDESNMIYAAEPQELRSKHIEYLIKHPELLKGTIEYFHNFINWLEGQEGKKPAIERW